MLRIGFKAKGLGFGVYGLNRTSACSLLWFGLIIQGINMLLFQKLKKLLRV